MDKVPAGPGPAAPTDQDGGDHDLALGCFASICRDRLADELLAFSRDCPQVDIGVHEMPRGALLPALRAGDLSLAVLPGEEEAGFRSILMWHDRVMVAMPPAHPLAARPTVQPSELSAQPFLVSRQQFGSDMHRFLAQLVLPQGPALSATIINLGLPRIMEQVAAGEGVALICESHADHLGSGVVARAVAAPGASFPVRAYWQPADTPWPLSALVRKLRQR